MAYFQRPIAAAAAVAITAVSVDLPAKLPKPSEATTCLEQDACSSSAPEFKTWASLVSGSKLSNMSNGMRFRVPIPDVKNLSPASKFCLDQNSLFSDLCVPIVSRPAHLALFRAAVSARPPVLREFEHSRGASSPEVMYRWHLPEKVSGGSECETVKSKTVVVLLGWLGAKQKHLKKYADWYTSQGYHAITFTFPMAEILSYKDGGKAEQHVDMLVKHLGDWLEEEEDEKNLVFHTFSNTGWLTYGVILEKSQKQDQSLIGNIKGCVVDSAPVAAPDPRVWASGFSAAFLKKQSIATKGSITSNGSGLGVVVGKETTMESIPAFTETALLAVLEKFFKVVLNRPKINRRLTGVLDVLSVEQPTCPQLYIYSSADRVIPAESVESFIEKQRKTGREVRACNFISSPHVDHFRNNPNLYSSQLTYFLDDCVLTRCKGTSELISQ
ncbi:hypothetical protein ACHQM5_004969 [Ranunculus cassubicifolius]